ncbi:RHS repeat-associated core domain-containing protein [Pseudoalteromonas luteoviolacea]|uniref:RHS repeat-associated core domain-containing protein n=1 Tax=Pseudoalteromonas luteoviolacea TaxID=43657 RepID=UPI00115201A1|nr:RHS repeat-associated core domain-containing protein [Pseudoalteromonas luteoviolacea]TQF67826.1 PQQ-binding-like beta-propeller repeat protein [Pseudoalteromonas luteoviolacea]
MKKSILLGFAGLLSCFQLAAQTQSDTTESKNTALIAEGFECDVHGVGEPVVQSTQVSSACDDKPIDRDPSELQVFSCALKGPQSVFLNETTTVNFHNSVSDVATQASVLDNTGAYIYNGQYYRLNGETIASNSRFSNTKGVEVKFTSEGKRTLYLFHKIYVRKNGQPAYPYTTNSCFREINVVKKTPPQVRLVLPSSSSKTIPVGQPQTVTFSVSDEAGDVRLFEIKRNNILVKTCSSSGNCSLTFTPTASEMGEVTYTAKAVDAHNVSGQASVKFDIIAANIKPTAQLTVTTANDTGTNVIINENGQVTLTAIFEDLNDDPSSQLHEGYLCEVENPNSCQTFNLAQCTKASGKNRFTCSTTKIVSKSVEFTAQAKDKRGLLSSLATANVKLNTAPNIALNISNNKTYAFIDEPYNITLTGTDPDSSGFDTAVICLFSGPSANLGSEKKNCATSSVSHTVCSTAGTSINCTSQIPAPTRHGQFTYYAYVSDKDGGKSVASREVYIRPLYGIRLDNISSGVEANADVNFDIKIGGFSSQTHALTDLQLYANDSIVQAYSFTHGGTAYTVNSDGKIRNAAGNASEIPLPTEFNGVVTLNARWPASISGDVTLRVTGTTNTGKVSTSGTFETSVAYPTLSPPSAVTITPLGNGKYSAAVAATANTTQYKWQLFIANIENNLVEKANYEQPAVNAVQSFQTQYEDDARLAKVCVSAVSVYQDKRQESAPTCSEFTISNTQPLPNKTLFSAGFKHQFSAPYYVNWQLNGNEYTAQYKLYGWQGSVADKPANPTLLKSTTSTDGEYFASAPEAGNYTYQIHSCNTQNVCVEGAYQTVNHIRAIISSVTHVVSTAKKNDTSDPYAQKPRVTASTTCVDHCIRIKGLGINDTYGRIDMRVKLNAKTYSVNTSSAKRIDAFTIEVKAENSVVEGFYEGGLTLQALNGITNAPKGLFHVYADAPNSHLDPINNPIVESISGRAYTTQDNSVLALTKQNIQAWSFDADGAATTPAVLSKSFTATNGAKQWQDEVYFGTTGHSFYKLNHEGHRVWQASTRGAITARAQVSNDGELYVGSHDKALYSFDPETGSVLWSYSFLYPVTEQVRLIGNDIHVTVQANKSDPSDLGETVLYIVDRNAIDANALRFDDINGTATNPLRDLLNGDNAGWQPGAQHPQLQSLTRLYYVLFKRLPSKDELSFMAFAYSQGVSTTEIITALLTSDEMKQALPGSMTNAEFVADMVTRLFPSGAPAPIASKTQLQWITFLDEGGKRAALIEAWLNTAQANAVHAQLAQRAIYYYYGHCTVDATCDQNKNVDSDNDNLSDHIETLIGSDPLNPDDGIKTPQLSVTENDGFGSFVLESLEYDASLSYQLVERTVENNHEQTLEFNFQQQSFTREPGQYSYKLQACKRVDIGTEQIESCTPYSNLVGVEVKSLVPDDAQFVDVTVPLVDSVGTIKGTASVSGGAATYSIPIELTPGRAGMQPSVSLNYSSRSGRGIAGKGWSLSAGSAVTRCASTFAQEGVSLNARYQADDKLCLNGQKLILISGQYGQSGAVYSTEIDSFDRVYQHGGDLTSSSSYFEVKHKNGRASYYGSSTSSKDVRDPFATGKGTYAWLIDYSSDATNNNFIHYSYREHGANEKLLASINYTGDSSSHTGIHNVHFEYEQSIDPTRKYHAGISFEKTQRLKHIVTKYYAEQTRIYNLSYVQSNASGVELLSSIELCYGETGSNCLPKTHLDWQDKAIAVGGTHVDINTGKSIAAVLPNGDRNGDGARDWPGFYINAEGGTTANRHSMTDCEYVGTSGERVNCTSDTADFDLDGLTDDYDFEAGSVGALKSFVLYKNNKDGSSTKINTGIELPNLSSILHLGDMNGDSLPDLVVYEKTPDYEVDDVNFYYHNGNFSHPYSVNDKQLLFNVKKHYQKRTPSESISLGGDFDGNGTPDFYKVKLDEDDVGQGQLDSILLMTPNGKELTSERKVINWGDEDDYRRGLDSTWARFYRFADLNGDGLKDWFGWYNPRVNGSALFVRYSQGDGTFTAPVNTGKTVQSRNFIFFESYGLQGQIEDSSSAYIPKYGDAIKIVDIDADGKEELLVPSGIVVEGCQNVHHAEYRDTAKTEFCGADIYSETIYSGYGKFKSIDGRYDRSIYAFAKLELTNGAFVQSGAGLIGTIYESVMVDAQGDGLPDLVFNYGCESAPGGSNCRYTQGAPAGYVAGKVNISRNYGTGTGHTASDYRPLDMLGSVTNGLGLKSEWGYKPLSSSVATGIVGVNSLYKADEKTEAGYQNFTSSMYVVNEFKQDNGIGGDFERRYAYRGAVYNNQGRGFMGFRSIIEANITQGVTTQTDFDQHFPYAGALVNRAVFVADDYTHDGRPLSEVESQAISHSQVNWADNLAHNIANVYSIYKVSSTEVTRDLATKAQLAVKEEKGRVVDLYGNLLSSENVHTDQFGSVKTQTVNTYEHTTNNWFINKLTKQVVTTFEVTTRNEQNAYTLYSGTESALDTQTTVTTEFNHFNAARQPETVTTSGSSGVGQQVDYEYNRYGLPTKITKSAQVYNDAMWATQSRSETIAYTLDGTSVAENGYYVFEAHNAKGHITRNHTDPKTGLKTSASVQVNQHDFVTTDYGYDAYLRAFSQKTQGMPTVYSAIQQPDSDAPADAVMQVVQIAAGAPTKVTIVDKLGRTIRTKVENQGGDWILQDSTYNAKGHIQFESQPYLSGQMAYGVRYGQYDALGRVDSKTTDQQCSAHVTGEMTASYTYNAFTTTINVSETCTGIQLDEMSRVYDSRNLLIETKDAMGSYTRYAYNGQGLPIVIRDALGNSIVAKYDAFGNKERVVDPNQGASDFTYNGFGEVQQELRNGTHSVYFSYDVLGRTTKRSATDEDTYVYEFDTKSFGQVTSTTGNGVTHSYDYDKLGRPVTHTVSGDGQSFTTKTYYDTNYGRVKGLRYPNHLTLEYIYDDKGYQTQTKNTASGLVYQNITARDAHGFIQSRLLGNGLTTDTYYSAQTGQMTEHTTRKNNIELLNIAYTSYDGFGNLTNMSVTSGKIDKQHAFTESYVYDHLHRLKENKIDAHTVITYGYDKVGNITSKSDYATSYNYAEHINGHSGGGANAVKKVLKKQGNWVGFSYDARGNMTAGDGLTHASYNAMDKPTRIVKNGITATFTYGADHMRFKQVNGSTTTYYAGKHYELDIQGSKTTTRAYIGDFAVISTESNGTPEVRYLHKDRLNSARLITDANGQVIAERNFDPFGKPRKASGGLKENAKLEDFATAKTKRGFTDHEHLDDLELIHMNGRVYDYNLGRFMSVDPYVYDVGNSQAINPYSYIMNNPLAGTDPTGYIAIIPVIGWVMKSYAAYETANTTVDAISSYKNGELSGMDVATTVATSAAENTVGKKLKIAKEGVQKMRQAFKGDKPNANNQKSQSASNTDGGSKGNGASSNQNDNNSNQATTDIGSETSKTPVIDRQKQNEHIKGTKEHTSRVNNAPSKNREPSTWDNPDEADDLTQEAWKKGSSVGGNENKKRLEIGRPIGTKPNGDKQSAVQVSRNKKGEVHGTPFGKDMAKKEEK